MSSSVTVLCPNGRRVSVKIGNNAPLLQVLDQVCQKQGLDPDRYELRRGKAAIDLSCTFRFSGLPNNAKLDMIPIDQPRQTNQDVVLMVQTAEGSRVQGTFPSSATLWDVLQHLKLDTVDDPAIIYMRQQVIGRERLMKTSLKDVGVSSGRVSIRLVSMKISEQTEEKCEEKQDGRERRNEITKSVEQDDKKEMKINTSIHPLEEEEVVKSKVHHHDDDDMPMFPVLPFSIFPEDSNPNTSLEAMETETNEQFQQEETFIASVAQYIQQNWQPPVVMQRQVSAERKIYEGSCDREPVIYNLDDTLPSTPVSEVPDEFFDVTVSDVQKMHKDLKEQVKSLSDAPLLTQQMRESIKTECHKKTVIRVILPDRWVLQGCFNNGESLKSLVKFVREHLAEPDMKFHLYTTPPKVILKSARPTFAEAGFVPAANIYFSPEGHAAVLSLSQDTISSAILSESSIKQYCRGLLHAELVASKERSHPNTVTENMSLEEPTVVQSTITKKRAETSENRSHIPASQRGVSSSGQKVPKWFKIGPK